LKTYRISIKGIVQGVGFRVFTKNIADVMNIEGYVKNESDGSVSALANLNDDEREKFLKELRVGPPSSKVESIDIEEIASQPFESFDIRH